MIERIRVSDFAETHFICLTETARIGTKSFERHYDNRDFKSLLVQTQAVSKTSRRVWNFIQCRNYEVRKRLARQHPDEAGGVAISMVEQMLDEISFGLGDARRGAMALVIDFHARGQTAAQTGAWLRKNCSKNAVMLEGNKCARVSFESDEDYLLARINFS